MPFKSKEQIIYRVWVLLFYFKKEKGEEICILVAGFLKCVEKYRPNY